MKVDTVKSGDVIAEIETEKPPWKWKRSMKAIEALLVEAGADVKVNTPIAKLHRSA